MSRGDKIAWAVILITTLVGFEVLSVSKHFSEASRQPSGQIGTTAPQEARTGSAEPGAIRVNGLRVIAAEGMDWLSGAKVLEAARYALETTKGGPSFSTCPTLTVSLVGENDGAFPGSAARAHYFLDQGVPTVELKRRSDVGTPVSIEAWRPRQGEDPLRHEFFHHYLEACGVTYAQKESLFEISHQVAPNGVDGIGDPRYWPNDDRQSPDAKWWLQGGAYDYRAGEDWAEMLHEMYDGENDGFQWTYVPNLDGRKKAAARQAKAILGL